MMGNGICFIYALLDPRDMDVVRYIGKTSNLVNRWNSHIRNSKSLKCRRSSWIMSLLNHGILPAIRIVMAVPDGEWQYWEKLVIEKFKSPKLTNGNDGGVGGSNPKPWVIDKISRSRRMASPEVAKKISESVKALWLDPSYRKRMVDSHAGKKQSLDWIEKRMIRMRGRVHSDQEKKNRSEALIKQRGVAVVNLDTGDMFNCLSDAAEYCGKSRSGTGNLSRAIKSNKSFCGFRWSRIIKI